MVRAPCCEKMGLKKGPWTREEDEILISYIQQHGHGNWRALPKQAGLLRCGKSCRLRWTNYLRPDIKRGNFSKEEEETIIKLHQVLGNRWSAIAARLPGRTDNEIKNVWHTHLKKKLKNYKNCSDTIVENSGPRAADLCAVSLADTKCCTTTVTLPKCDSNVPIQSNHPGNGSPGCGPVSPQPSSSDLSSVSDANVPPSSMVIIKDEQMDTSIDNTFPEIIESFWHEQFSADNSDHREFQLQFPWSPVTSMVENVNECGFNIGDGNDFWYNIFTRAGDLPELPEF